MRWRYLKILLTTVLSTAYNGTAIRTNVKPPKSPAAKITTIIVKGWILKDLPITFGVMILPSSWCAINVMIQTHINVVGLYRVLLQVQMITMNLRKELSLRHQQIELIKEYMVSQ